MSFGSLGIVELLIVLLIVLLLFGSRRLPALGAALGSTFKQFRRGLKDD